MKKLLMALAIASIFIASTTFAATVNCVMLASENDGLPPLEAGDVANAPPITSDYYFTIEVDGSNNVTAFTDLFGAYWGAHEQGGWNTEDGAPFDAGEQIFKDSVAYDVATIIWDGVAVSEVGHGLWFRGLTNPADPNPGLVINAGILDINFDGIDGNILTGNLIVNESYVFHAVPIPSAIWLLGSSLIGLIGFRRKFRKV